ncbi:glutathione ABC transporter ATP-binding protein GsiA, partial [Escherichia coli]|nr:glutathione ABC transporter ATP-binding protein GsiA [Escherichia coli]
LITHDMGVVAEMADRVAIMQNGRIVEQGEALAIFERPSQTYTQELLAAVPRLGAHAGTEGPPRVSAQAASVVPVSASPILHVRNLNVTYGSAARW